MKKLVRIGVVILSCLSVVVSANDDIKLKKTITKSEPAKVSKPFRELAKPLPKLTKQRKFKMSASGDTVPGYGQIKEIPNRFPYKNKGDKLPEGYVDRSAQTSLDRNLFNRLAPEFGVSFEGVGNVNGVAPPDTNGDVGPNHYVQTVNLAMAVWDKSGNQLMAPTNTNALWAGFGGRCEFQNDGDPIVLYDSAADRWLISQFAVGGSTDNRECIAISTTGDPTGSYYLYDFDYGPKFNDYPKLGVWTDGYYMGVNQFSPSFTGGGVVAYDRDAMLVGAPATQIKFDMEGNNPEVFTPMPLDIDGFLPPPAGANQYFIWASAESGEFDRLHVWELVPNWDDPAASTFSPVTVINVSPYGASGGVTQPNGSALDTIAVRSMFRAAYRNLDGQGKIVFTHNVQAPAGAGEAALRWYEIDVDQLAGTATVAQEGTFAPDTNSRWMGSGAMDINGNLAFGYSLASPDVNPSIYAATRLATDPANTLTDEFMLLEGGGSQSGTSRWGDYSSMSVDPTDECTFWFTTEYYKAEDNNTVAWSTWISSFRIPTCSAGPRGEITGVVTDSATGEPIASAVVSAGLATARTDETGSFIITLPVGDYDVTATKYGWVENTPLSVTVLEDDSVSGDIVLDAADPVVVSGMVEDSLAGRALYSRIDVAIPDGTISAFTDPETGQYSVTLFEGTTVSVTATEVGVGGYMSASQDILPVSGAEGGFSGVDFDLTANSNCTAPGYAFVDPSFFEGFDVFPPAGWTIVDDLGTGVIWSSYLASSRVFTGVDGDAAIADSDAVIFADFDTSLISPSIAVADLATFELQFDGLFRTFSGGDFVDVDVSVDGGEWTNVGGLNPVNSLDPYSFDITTAVSGGTEFQLRFRYYNGNWQWYALVDNVRFGNRACLPQAGSLVSGVVTDANTGLPLVGAEISAGGSLLTTSIATSSNADLSDGFFQAFVADTSTTIDISVPRYETASVDVGAVSTAAPIALNAGLLSADVSALSTTITAGRTDSQDLVVSNSGTASANFNAFFVKGDSTDLPNGPFHPSARHFGPKNLNDYNAKNSRYFPEFNIAQLDPGELVGVFFLDDITYGWGISRNRVSGEFHVGDISAGGAPADVIWRYNADGTFSGEGVELDFVETGFFADSAFNQRTGKLWQVNVGGQNCIHEIDTDAGAVTGQTICPNFGTSQRGLAYDPITDTFYSGSWNDSIIHQFDTEGNILRSVNVGLDVAGLAFNAETNHLFISVNDEVASGAFDIVVVDAASPTFVKVGGYDVRLDIDGDGVADDVVTDFGQAGLDIDCNGNLWLVEQNQQVVVGFESGETGVCEWNNVPWLSISSTVGDLEASASSDIVVSYDSTGLAAGDYAASIVYNNDTPYGSVSIPVSMTLTEPSYGTAAFTISNTNINENTIGSITVARNDGADFAISVDYSTVDGSAVAGENYAAVSGTLTWDDMDNSPKTISIPTLNVDENVSFTVVLSNPQGGAALGSSITSVTVVDVPEKDSGSFGLPMLALLALAGLYGRRRRSLGA